MKALFRLSLACFLLVSPLWGVAPAAAQGTITLTVGALDTHSFPLIRFSCDGLDADGTFLQGIRPEAVRVLEDGHARRVEALKEVQSGLQIIFAINPSPAMSSPGAGSNTYQRIQTALVSWANAQPEPSPDDFSIATPSGLFRTRERSPKRLVQALAEYTPDLARSQPTLNSLAEALDLATDPPGRAGIKRAILWITPALPAAHNAALADLGRRANQIGVPVHVWQVGPAASGADPLRQLAETTQGRFSEIAFDGDLPEIEPLFAPLRHSYEVEYTSGIQTSGPHSLSLVLEHAGQEVSSNQLSFDLTVQAPNPIFLSPPAAIHRTWVAPKNGQPASLTPGEVALQILIEFPDQHPRAIQATRLYLNDRLIQENTAAPFDRFTWSLEELTTPARAMLRVEVVDALDLSGSSIVTPVELTIAQPAATRLIDHTSGRGLVALATVAVAGSALTLVLVLTNTQRKLRLRQIKFEQKRKKDPLTQPLAIAQEPARPRKGNAGAWSAAIWPRPGNLAAPARLVALDEQEQPIPGGAIFLSRQEMTFGTDPRRATQVLDSPTVNELHSRLFRSPDGHFLLADQGSIAGTWLNFAPVTPSGARLEHGDLIHIGKVMFRFELANPEPLPPGEIMVTHLEQEP